MVSLELNIALTTDLWKSRSVESYLTVTADRIDEQWKLCTTINKWKIFGL